MGRQPCGSRVVSIERRRESRDRSRRHTTSSRDSGPGQSSRAGSSMFSRGVCSAVYFQGQSDGFAATEL